LFVYAFFGFYLFQGQFSNPVNINNIVADYLFSITGVGQEILIPLSRNALWFTDSISIVSIVIFFYSLALLFQPLIENTKITHQEKIRLRDLILHNGENSVSYFALMDDKQYFFNSSKTCVIAYKIRNGVALALGDPIGESKLERTYCIEQFVADNTKKDLKTAFYNTGESMSLIYEGLGYKSIKIGEEALIPTNTFTLNGSAMADVRHEVNKIKREQGIFAWYTMDTIPWKYVNEINSIHYAWTRQKKSLQLTYSLDYFPFPIEENAFIQIIKGQNERIWGILSYFPFNGGKGMVLDFMMRASGSPHGIIEAGINEAIEFFKARGIHFLSLGMAPLSDIDVKSENNVTQKAKNLIFENFNQFYQYKSLFKFKSKFNPLWLHKYLVYKNEIDLPAIIIAVAQAHLKEPLNIYNLLK
jgi:phosphatidylglycerol lysyltransferase